MKREAVNLRSLSAGVVGATSAFVVILIGWGGGVGLLAAQRAGGAQASRVSTAAAAPVTVAQIMEAIQAHVHEHLGHVGTVQVELLDSPDALPVAPSGARLRVIPGSPEDALGRRPFTVILEIAGQEHGRLAVTAEVSVLARVVTATRTLRPDEVLEPDDVAVMPVRLRTARHDFLADLDEAIGKRVIKPVSAGAPIRRSALAEPYSVKKGDRVTIEAKRGGLTIQTAGVTKSAGKIGQIVAVTNQDSGREIRARVVGPGLVQVDF